MEIKFCFLLDIAPLTMLDSGALQPRMWQLIGTGCSIGTGSPLPGSAIPTVGHWGGLGLGLGLGVMVRVRVG